MINIEIRENKNRLLLILLALILISVWFYWFELRPARIRHDCSWVKETESAVPAHPAMTEEELKTQGLIQACPTQIPKGGDASRYDEIFGQYADPEFEQRREKLLRESCEQKNKEIMEEYSKPRERIPAKENWRKATDQEYKFCLRDKGL